MSTDLDTALLEKPVTKKEIEFNLGLLDKFKNHRHNSVGYFHRRWINSDGSLGSGNCFHDGDECCQPVKDGFRHDEKDRTLMVMIPARRVYSRRDEKDLEEYDTIFKEWTYHMNNTGCFPFQYLGFKKNNSYGHSDEESDIDTFVFRIDNKDMVSNTHALATFSVIRYLYHRRYKEVVPFYFYLRSNSNFDKYDNLQVLVFASLIADQNTNGYYGLVSGSFVPTFKVKPASKFLDQMRNFAGGGDYEGAINQSTHNVYEDYAPQLNRTFVREYLSRQGNTNFEDSVNRMIQLINFDSFDFRNEFENLLKKYD